MIIVKIQYAIKNCLLGIWSAHSLLLHHSRQTTKDRRVVVLIPQEGGDGDLLPVRSCHFVPATSTPTSNTSKASLHFGGGCSAAPCMWQQADVICGTNSPVVSDPYLCPLQSTAYAITPPGTAMWHRTSRRENASYAQYTHCVMFHCTEVKRPEKKPTCDNHKSSVHALMLQFYVICSKVGTCRSCPSCLLLFARAQRMRPLDA